MILVSNPISVVQLLQQHWAETRKCTDGVYLMYPRHSAHNAVPHTKEICFLVEISKRKVWIEWVKDEC